MTAADIETLNYLVSKAIKNARYSNGRTANDRILFQNDVNDAKQWLKDSGEWRQFSAGSWTAAFRRAWNSWNN